MEMNKVCKNKKCQKLIPDGYKHKYCEACRNQRTQKVKNGLKVTTGLVGTATCLIVALRTGGKIKLKK